MLSDSTRLPASGGLPATTTFAVTARLATLPLRIFALDFDAISISLFCPPSPCKGEDEGEGPIKAPCAIQDSALIFRFFAPNILARRAPDDSVFRPSEAPLVALF